jgi:hypothetical protein
VNIVALFTVVVGQFRVYFPTNPITFMKSIVQRDLRLPVAHCLTLFNVAEVYHNDQFLPRIPGSLYRDPFSDMIPRERIYEIWTQEPIVSIGPTQRTRSQCIAEYTDVAKMQIGALQSVVWKYSSDMAGRLHSAASPMSASHPFNFQGMSEDGRLWYGWALLEEACKDVELRRAWSAEPDELEANYSILRFDRILSTEANGELVYHVRPTSQNCKFKDNDAFLALQDESFPGFLDLRLRDLLDQVTLQQYSQQDRNRKMADIFSGTLLTFDRTNLTARVALNTFEEARSLRRLLIEREVVDISKDVSLIATSGRGMAGRVMDCLQAIGRPPMASAAPETYIALGHSPGRNPPRNDPVTPAARILWEAPAFAGEGTGLRNETIQAAIQTVAETGWPLNTSQRAAVSHCLGHRLSIVWGPPGTGKTTTAASLVVTRILAARDLTQNLRILISGPTYTAWEKLFGEILELLDQAHVSGVSCYRVYSSTHRDRAPLPAPNNSVTDIEARSLDPEFQTFWSVLQKPRRIILVGAVSHQCYRIAKQGAGSAMVRLFDHLVIDESSQLDLGKSLYPLCLLSAQPEVALFGDHLQMPPVIATQPPSNAEWLVGSIQKYLTKRFKLPVKELLINYRSAASFVEFGKRIGYPTELSAHSEDLKLHITSESAGTAPAGWENVVPWFAGLNEILKPRRRLTAVSYEDGRSGQANEFEADIVCCIAQQLFLTGSQNLDGERDKSGRLIVQPHMAWDPHTFWDRGVGIVTPHRAQRALIVSRLREIFPTHDPQKLDAAVDTVERFQGGERDTIIISFGVGDPDLILEEEGFLLQYERTNVAISRARAKCILLISEDLAYHLPSDRKTIETSKAVKEYVSEFCRESLTVQGPSDNSQRALTIRWHDSAE